MEKADFIVYCTRLGTIRQIRRKKGLIFRPKCGENKETPLFLNGKMCYSKLDYIIG